MVESRSRADLMLGKLSRDENVRTPVLAMALLESLMCIKEGSARASWPNERNGLLTTVVLLRLRRRVLSRAEYQLAI